MNKSTGRPCVRSSVTSELKSFVAFFFMCLCLLSGVSVAMFKHHTGAITSVEWHPTDSSVFVASGSDDQVTLWDLAVERDSEADGKGRQLDVPPQLLFIHMVSDDE